MNHSTDGAGESPPGTIKIIGIGQSMRGDDAAGLFAVRFWIEKFHPEILHPEVQVELAELPGIGLLNLLEGVHFAILVDAVHTGASPGTIHSLTEDQLESFCSGSGSAHGWGVAETLSLGRQLAPASLPPDLLLIGIEVGQLDLGETLSPEVYHSLPEVARQIDYHVSTALPH